MNYETIKTAADVTLDGCKVEVEKRDGTVAGVTITDAAGHVVRVVCGESWSNGIKVLVPAKPKMVKRWSVVGEVLGLMVDERFADHAVAEARRSELADCATGPVDLKVVEVEVADEAA